MRTSLRHRGRQRLGLLTGLIVTGVAVNALVWWNSQPIGLESSEPQELPVPELVKQVMPSIVKVQSGSSFGTGFAIDSTTVLTNAHVIQNPNNILLIDRQGKMLQPKLIGLDQGKDVAVLAVSKGTLPPLVIGSSRNALVGQAVIAIGMPMGEDYTVTSGILSAKDRQLESDDIDPDSRFLQTDAAINPGNSGGPLFNAFGEVIGINSRIRNHAEGINFSIPIEDALRVAEDIKAKGGKP